MASRIRPPLLEPYLSLPDEEATLIVLTGVLGACPNWLVLRFLHSFLRPVASSGSRQRRSPTGAGEDGSEHEDLGAASVLLVGFLRDFAFWKDGAARLGLDLEGQGRKGKFGFVDGLGALFTGGGVSEAQVQQTRGTTLGFHPKQWTLTSPAVADIGRVLHAAVDDLQARSGGGKVVVVVDQLDLLLAAAAGDGSVSDLALRELLLDLREKSHTVVLTLAADEPLIGAQTTMLEKGHSSFVLSLAHEARMVVSLRLLDTGTAKDVSGVMRITNGGNDSGTQVEEREYLYHVAGDGGVRVFERGQ